MQQRQTTKYKTKNKSARHADERLDLAGGANRFKGARNSTSGASVNGARAGEPGWEMGDRFVDMVTFTMRLGLFVMNLAAITMGVLVLEV